MPIVEVQAEFPFKKKLIIDLFTFIIRVFFSITWSFQKK